jgi:4-amino-4-deoxy-L-arabinose transferase-like glycosyltransferase
VARRAGDRKESRLNAATPPIPRLGRAGLALFALALAVRVAAVLWSGVSTTRFADAPAYLLAARSLAETGRYPLRTDPHLFRPPGYPVFLVAATLDHPDRIAAARLANALLGALAAPLLAALSARIFRRRGVALVTGAVAAVHPTFVLASSDLQTEPLFLVLLLCAGYLLLVAGDRPSSNFALLAGALLALAALTRSSALVLIPLLLAPLWDGRFPRRVGTHLAGSALLGFALTLAPWTLRNALVFHEAILVNDGAGYVFYGRNAEPALAMARARSREELQAATDAFEREREARIAALPPEVRASPGRLSRALFRAALEQRAADPRGTLRLLAWKAWDWLRPYPDPRFWPPALVVAGGAYFTALYAAAAVGLARASRPGVRLFVLVFLAVTLLFHLALETSWRYRAAYWDPVLLLYGVAGAASLAGFRAPPRAPSRAA